MRRKETLLGQLDREDSSPVSAPDFPPGQKAAILGASLVGILFIAYSLLGFFFAPWLIRRQVEAALEKQTALSLEIRQVGFNPYTLTTAFKDLEILDESGTPLADFESLRLNLQVSSFFQKGWNLKAIRLLRPEIYLRRDVEGLFNWSRVLSGSEASETDESSEENVSFPILTVQRTSIEEGVLYLEDRRPESDYTNTIYPINVNLRKFSTGASADSQLSMKAEGEKESTFELAATGNTWPLRLEGSFSIKNLGVHHFSPYFISYLNFELEESHVDFHTGFRVDLTKANPVLALDSGTLLMRDSYLRTLGGEERFFSIPELVVEGIETELFQRRFGASRISLNGGEVLVVVEDEGGINLVDLLSLKGTSAGGSQVPQARERPSWSYAVDTVHVQDFEVLAEDPLAFSPARFKILVEQMTMEDLGNNRDSPASLSGSYRIGDAGTIEVEGTLSLQPVALSLTIDGRKVPVHLVEPYLEKALLIDIESGLVYYQGSLEIELDKKPAWIQLKGNGFIEALELVHEEFPEGRAKMEKLMVNNFHFERTPSRFEAEHIEITGLQGTYFRLSDGSWLTPYRVLVGSGSSEPENKESREGSINLTIQRLTVADSRMAFLDRSLTPAFRSSLSKINGEITTISTTADAVSRVNLQGTVNETNRWTLEGKGTLLDPENQMNLRLELEPLDILVLNSYSEKFLGRSLETGLLSASLDYTVDQKELTGENNFRLKDLQLGSSVPSDSTVINFPLGLAVSSLQDRNQVMDLNFQVNGRMDDPSFDLSGVIFKSMIGILGKAATSPFSLLESLVGAEDDLESIRFAAGDSDLSEEAKGALDQLAVGLKQRPGLNLEIQGGYDPVHDRSALKLNSLQLFLQEMQEEDSHAPQGDLEKDKELYQKALHYALNTYGKDLELASEPVPADKTSEPTIQTTTFREVELELEVGSVERRSTSWFSFLGGGPSPEKSAVESVVITGKRPVTEQALSPADPSEASGFSLDFPEELPPVEILEEQMLNRVSLEEGSLEALAEFRKQAVQHNLSEKGITQDRFVPPASKADPRQLGLQVRFSLTAD